MSKKKHPCLQRLWLLLTGLLLACSGNDSSQKIDIYVMPFYNSNPLEINIGKYSEQLKANSAGKMREFAEEIKSCVDEVDAVTLYVLAIRLYNLGEKDAAAYWYYNAQFRKNVFLQMSIGLDPSGAPAALQSFNSLSGRWINYYMGQDPDKWAATVEQVMHDVANMGYIAKAYAGYDNAFKPESEQAKIIEAQLEDMRKFVKYARENKEEILRTRKENEKKAKF